MMMPIDAPTHARASGRCICCVSALVLTRVMQSLLFAVEPTDSVSFAVATMLLMAITLLASYLPARRAASVDPAVTLRSE